MIRRYLSPIKIAYTFKNECFYDEEENMKIHGETQNIVT
jgi:hypothetical protein